MIIKPRDRNEWLEKRRRGLGGSDAGTAIGLNDYKTNVQLWEEKTGQKAPEDISNNPAVSYGKLAEPHLREMFKLDFPEYSVDYHEFYMYVNDEYPFIFATLDGELTETETGKKGILEIKTTTIKNSLQWQKWDGEIPDSYYIQILHQLIATGWNFAILKAYIRYYKDEELRATVRHYRIDREDVTEDLQYLLEQEITFWQKVKNGERPPLILPKI